ncbi:hypothetical protein Tco_0276059 [Tanacetum coccineum]
MLNQTHPCAVSQPTNAPFCAYKKTKRTLRLRTKPNAPLVVAATQTHPIDVKPRSKRTLYCVNHINKHTLVVVVAVAWWTWRRGWWFGDDDATVRMVRVMMVRLVVVSDGDGGVGRLRWWRWRVDWWYSGEDGGDLDTTACGRKISPKMGAAPENGGEKMRLAVDLVNLWPEIQPERNAQMNEKIEEYRRIAIDWEL